MWDSHLFCSLAAMARPSPLEQCPEPSTIRTRAVLVRYPGCGKYTRDPVRREVVVGAPMTRGQARDLDWLSDAEGKAAIRGRTNRYALQEPLRVDVDNSLPSRATPADRHRLWTRLTVAAAPTRCAPRRLAGPIRPHEREPSTVGRDARVAFNERFVQQWRAGALESNRTAHTSPPDTLTTRKPPGDQSVVSQWGRGQGSVCTGPTPSALETFSVGAALVPER